MNLFATTGRQVRNVLFLGPESHMCKQSRRFLHAPKWTKDDTRSKQELEHELMELLPLLKTAVESELYDVSDVTMRYGGKNGFARFNKLFTE
ncbi:MAG: hypothetical protein MHM6MM_008555 [Cercozoa sp. M6MM]